MAQFLSAVSAVAVILALVGTGVFCGWRGWMTAAHKNFCVKVVINIGIPAMCLNSLLRQVDMALLRECGILVAIAAADVLILLALALLLVRPLGLPREKAGTFVVMAAFANSIFIGMPVCTLLFGEEATPYVLCYYIVNTVGFQSVGLFVMNYFGAKGGRVSLGKMARGMVKPPLVTILLALTMILLDLQLPDMVMNWLGYLGNLVTPLALLYSGFILYENGVRNLRLEASHWVAMVFRFLGAPLLMAALCRWVGAGELASQVLTIEIAMPVMTQTVVFAADTGEDEHYAVIGMASTTLACFLVIPVLMVLV